MAIIIEQNVPLIALGTGFGKKPKSELRQAMELMAVGDSFALPDRKSAEKANGLRGQASMKGKRFAVRGLRVWRTA